MEDMKKVGRVGGKALLYFEIVSTFALVLGLRRDACPEAGRRLQRRSGDARRQGRSLSYAAKAHGQSTVDFLHAHHSRHVRVGASRRATSCRCC